MNIEERAREFCQGTFGPFGVDIEPYTKIVAELLAGAVAEENARLAAQVKGLNSVIDSLEKCWADLVAHHNSKCPCGQFL